MRKIKLTTYEKELEKDLLQGVYIPVKQNDFLSIAESVAHRKKDKVLNIRVNSQDLSSLKHKAEKLGLKYQTFISEVLHKVAM